MPKKRGMHSGKPEGVIETIQELFSFKADPAHIKSGKWGEKLAVRFLKAQKWSILGERVRSGRHDELDIVAQVNDALVFVEVKTRRSEKFGRPFSAVNAEKRKRLSRAAVNYLKEKNIKPKYIRFDVVEVIGEPGNKSPEVRHIENAFPLDSGYKLWW
jgi:putative endonuclease